MAKRVQGALPIVGLVSRLTAAEGGFDELVCVWGGEGTVVVVGRLPLSGNACTREAAAQA